MVISAEKVPASPPESLTPSISFPPPKRLRVSIKSSLHDFDFPGFKTWGRHQVLRCLHVNRKDETNFGKRGSDLIGASANLPEQMRLDYNQVSINDDSGSEEVKAGLTSKMYDPEPVHPPEALRAHSLDAPPASISDPAPSLKSPSNVTRPCNLRTRRVPISKTPCSNASPPPPGLDKRVQTRSVRLRSASLERREHWPKISIHLSRKEIEEDIYAVTGSRPRQRPRKRPRVIQRQLEQLFPGSFLPSISPASYQVPD